MISQGNKIDIPVILEVGRDKLANMGYYINKVGIKKIVFYYGEGIKELFGHIVVEALAKYPEIEILSEVVCDDNTMEYITQNAFTIPAATEAIVGIGGGKVLDVAKYISFLTTKPFISIPTSTAHDGFASSGCSLVVNGRRKSLPAHMPYGVIVDINIVKNAPVKFLYSGVGEIISNITAIYDWKYEESQGVAYVDDLAVMIAKKSVNSVVRIPFTDIKDDFFIKELVDSLTMSGISMEIAGNSAPGSGSEHLISHALDKMLETPQLHGVQVGIAAYIMSKVQNHRCERVEKFLRETGFFEFIKTLEIKADDYIRAIDMAPNIKPNRKTYIHSEENREKAKKIIMEDELLRSIFKY